MLAPEIVDKPRRRPHVQGCSADDEHIRRGDGLHGPVHHLLVQRFLIEHHIRLDDAAAGAPGNAGGMQNVVETVKFAAALAVVAVHAAVKLIDVSAA